MRVVMLTGGCFCGRIRYETDAAPYHQTSCHCSICRRTSGAPYVAWFSVPRSRLRLHGGAPVRFRSSAKATRSFCPECGTPLPHDRVPPADHSYAAARLEWVKLDDGLRQFRASRAEG